MNKILTAIKCANCQNNIEMPVLLPCSDSICKKHTNQNQESVICHKCGIEHKIPKDGFPANKALAEIIEAELEKLDFGKTHNQAKESCKLFENELKELEVTLNDPSHYTNQKINDLKNTVQLKGEKLKLRIDQEMDKLFGTLEEYERQCKAFLSTNEYRNETAKLSNELKISQYNLDSWIEILNKINLDEQKWVHIINVSDQNLKSTKSVLDSYKNKLLLNNFDETNKLVSYFESIDIEPLFGKIQSAIIPFSYNQLYQTSLQNLGNVPAMKRGRKPLIIKNPLTNEIVQPAACSNIFNYIHRNVTVTDDSKIDPNLNKQAKLDSLIINNENLLQKLSELLKNKNLNNKQWLLLYRSSRDGCKASDFHSLCDNKQWSLLYRSSRDGCKASDFHSLCDNKPRTLTIIKATSGNIFGGYKNLATNVNLNDYGSFIFSLVNKENRALIFEYSKEPQFISLINLGNLGLYGASFSGPVFESDIVICDNFDSCNGSYSNLGSCYSHPDFAPNTTKSQCFLAGSYNFQVDEIEVFQIN